MDINAYKKVKEQESPSLDIRKVDMKVVQTECKKSDMSFFCLLIHKHIIICKYTHA